MKRLTAILFVIFCALLIACGGGGGGGTTTGSTGGVGPFSSLRMEATLDGTTTLIDPSNIFPGEKVNFAITAIDGGQIGNPRVKLNVNNFALTGTPGGSITGAGAYSGSSTPSAAAGTVTATAESLNFSLPIRVVPAQATLTGRIRLTTGTPVNRIQLIALNAAGTTVATGLTTPDGTLRMSLPTTAVKFTINFDIADPGFTFYVRQFAYNGSDYSPGVVGCTAPLPTLTNGATAALPADIFVYFQSDLNPPPPPNGCG